MNALEMALANAARNRATADRFRAQGFFEDAEMFDEFAERFESLAADFQREMEEEAEAHRKALAGI